MKTQHPLRNSLERQLATVLGTGLLVCSLLIGAFSFYLGYQNELEAVALQEANLVRTIQSQAEVAVFAENVSIADDVLNGLLTNDIITDIHLLGHRGFNRDKSRSKHEDLSTEAHVYPLYSPLDPQARIGELFITTDKNKIRDRAIFSALSDVFIQLLLIALAVLLLAVIFQRLIGQPIVTLAKSLSALTPGSGQYLTIDTKHANDEIGLLSTSVNRMIDATEHALHEERQIRQRIEVMESHYRRIFETAHVGIIVLDAQGKLMFQNSAQLLQKLRGTHAGDNANFIFDTFNKPDQAWALIEKASAAEHAVGADLQIKSDICPSCWVHCILTVYRDDLGQVLSIEGVLYDVTARHQRETEVRNLAENDMLTGLQNRNGIEQFFARTLPHAHENSLVIGIMLIDLDGFKAINDTYGHAAGDEVLITVADRLRHCIRRSSDMIGRLGGDEFLIAIYNCGEDTSMLAEMASELITTLAQPITLCDSGTIVNIGASIGISRFPLDAPTKESLFWQADQAMYHVKKSGKNAFAFAAERGATHINGTVQDAEKIAHA